MVIGGALLLSGCEKQAAAPPAAPPPKDVEIVQIGTTDVPVVSEFVGRTASSQRVEIRARVNGFLDEITYTEGDFVDEGDTLFVIDREPFEARLRAAKAEVSQHQARLDNANALLARVEPLAEAQAVAQKELDDALGEMRSAAAAVEEAAAGVYEAELNLGYTTISSPVAGLTSFATQREGAYLDTTSGPLTYVARIDPIWVEFSIAETQILNSEAASRSGQVVFPEEGAFEVEIILADGKSHPERGTITFADASVSDQTGTVLIRAVLPNPENMLRPGQFVRIRLHGAYRPGAVVVPQRGVHQGSKGPYAWVVNAQGQAEQRPIDLGPWSEESGWIVESGLRKGDRLIVNGSVGLRPGQPVSIVGIAGMQPLQEDAGQ